MVLLPAEDCDACTAPGAMSSLWRSLHTITPALAIASIPFFLTFLIVALFAWQSLFPRLSGRPAKGDARRSISNFGRMPWVRFLLDRAAAITFSTTIALSAVLAELIFCEISNLVNPAARKIALETTISVLLVSLVIVTPALEIHSFTSAIGLLGAGKGRLWVGLVLDLAGLATWFASFWWIGEAVLHEAQDESRLKAPIEFNKGSLERIGIIGVSLMASLAGFAAISSVWQTFGRKARKVADTDLARKQHGLNATTDLLHAKESRLRALERKMGDMPQESFFGRIYGSLRGGNPDTQEMLGLQLEISGLESMQVSLQNQLTLLQTRQAAQKRSSTAYGRVCLSTSYVFSIYCVYRIGATTAATLRRWVSPSTSTFASTDPINNFLAIVAKHWDPSIDRAAWSRQISFLLSGVMLLASFNAVLQTVLLFSRFTPSRLQQSAQQNLALLVSQISATYVVSSALLLRSNLPREMGSVIEGALGDPLDTAFVEKWFEGWFLGVCFVTAAGIWLGRKIGGAGEWDDDFEDEDVEMGKMRRA